MLRDPSSEDPNAPLRQEAFGLKPGDLLYDTIQEGSPSEDEAEQHVRVLHAAECVYSV